MTNRPSSLPLLFGLTLAVICPAGAAVLNVGPTRGITTIQAGVNAASNGDTVLVDSATYSETVLVNKTLTMGGGPISGATLEVQAGGSLTLSATFNGQITVDPGNTSLWLGQNITASTLTVNGALHLLTHTLNVTNNVTFGPNSSLYLQLDGTSSGSYGKLSAANVSLGGSLNALLTNGYQPNSGDSYPIVPGPTTGTFAGLPQGGTTSVGGIQMKVVYGSVTLVAPTVATVPALSSTMLLLLAVGIAAAGLLLGLRRERAA